MDALIERKSSRSVHMLCDLIIKCHRGYFWTLIWVL